MIRLLLEKEIALDGKIQEFILRSPRANFSPEVEFEEKGTIVRHQSEKDRRVFLLS